MTWNEAKKTKTAFFPIFSQYSLLRTTQDKHVKAAAYTTNDAICPQSFVSQDQKIFLLLLLLL